MANNTTKTTSQKSSEKLQQVKATYPTTPQPAKTSGESNKK